MTTRPADAHVGRVNEGGDEDRLVPEGLLAPAMRAALETRLEAAGFGRFDRPDIFDAVASVYAPELARLQRIEAAALDLIAVDDRWGLLFPVRDHPVVSPALQALRAAVEGTDRADSRQTGEEIDR